MNPASNLQSGLRVCPGENRKGLCNPIVEDVPASVALDLRLPVVRSRAGGAFGRIPDAEDHRGGRGICGAGRIRGTPCDACLASTQRRYKQRRNHAARTREESSLRTIKKAPSEEEALSAFHVSALTG